MVKIIAKHNDHKWIVEFIDEESDDIQFFTFIYRKKDRETFLKNLRIFGNFINGKSLKRIKAIRRYFWTRYI